jgi:hypothetical protein
MDLTRHISIPEDIDPGHIMGQMGNNLYVLAKISLARLALNFKNRKIRIRGTCEALAIAKGMLIKQFIAHRLWGPQYGHPSLSMNVLSEDFMGSKVRFVPISVVNAPRHVDGEVYYQLDAVAKNDKATNDPSKVVDAASFGVTKREFYNWNDLDQTALGLFAEMVKLNKDQEIPRGKNYGYKLKARFTFGYQMFYADKHQQMPSMDLTMAELAGMTIGHGRSDSFCSTFDDRLSSVDCMSEVLLTKFGFDCEEESEESVAFLVTNIILNVCFSLWLTRDQNGHFQVEQLIPPRFSICFLSVIQPPLMGDRLGFRVKLYKTKVYNEETIKEAMDWSNELLENLDHNDHDSKKCCNLDSVANQLVAKGAVHTAQITGTIKEKTYSGLYKGDKMSITITDIEDNLGRKYFEVEGSSQALDDDLTDQDALKKIIQFHRDICDSIRKKKKTSLIADV